MTLRQLFEAAAAHAPLQPAGLERLQALDDRPVTGLAYDSRQVVAGAVFVALRGSRADGAQFAREAARRGALLIVAETPAPEGFDAPWLQVADARLVLAALAAAFYEDPSRKLVLVGITGTNGKTTTTYLLTAILEAAGIRCGRLGTVSHWNGRREVEAARTTPEAPDVQRMLAEMVLQGCGACVMEVSSHALALRRADCLTFGAGVFTNLTRDHLDFHRDMQDYFTAKRRLAALLPAHGIAVANVDDPRGAEFAAGAPRAMTFAIDAAADVTPGPIAYSFDGLRFEARTPGGVLPLRSALVGRPNAYNILAAVATAVALEVPLDAVALGVERLTSVPGRFQIVSSTDDAVRVVVDYAHTDDALKNLLETARPLARGRIITVFGCGGDRDRPKRPLMGAVAARLSDLVIVTSDNPRSEDPEQIIEEIKRGIVLPADRAPRGQAAPKSPPHLGIVDRKAAIERAIRDARPGDLVLIAGKGHEKYQVIGDKVLPFDDVEVARAALLRRRPASQVK